MPEKNDKNLKINIEIILKLFYANKFNKAIDILNNVSMNYPNEPILYNIKGACFAGIGDEKNAIKSYEQAIRLDPSYAKAYYNLAGILHDLKNYNSSISSYKKTIYLESNNAEAHNNLGNVYRDIKQDNLAISFYEKAININPNYVEAWFSLGKVQETLRNLDSALKSYIKVLEVKPKFAELNNTVGKIYEELGEFKNSLEYYEKAAEIDPNFEEPLFNSGLLYKQLGQYHQAIDYFKKLIIINPSNIDLYLHLVEAYINLDKIALAVKTLEIVIKLKPGYAEVHNNLANLYKKQGKIDLALIFYKNAIDLKPELEEAHNNLGITYMELGKVIDAINHYQIATKLNNEFHFAYCNLGIAYKEIGDNVSAIKSFKKALEIQPDYAEPIHMLNILNGFTSIAPPQKYVEKLFDDFSTKFDKTLKELNYKLPFIVNELIRGLDNNIIKYNKAIDLGCGTGLAGNDLRSICKNLTGIDLSKKMLEEARKLKIYDNLIAGDIVKILNSSSLSYDLFIALDVLIYIGEVGSIFKSVRERCNKNAIFIFSVEVQNNDGYSLLKTGRYSHSESYILNNAFNLFKLKDSREVILRKEKGKNIDGKIFIFQAS
jgi:predicted TPR repeat methyltransferase